eukprot:TRINITY_DN10498_c0_g1_i1.p1 TRINITY_DN10498_c0_g1~~TRINITY_DN10498_c0_g1_i1.p1  ORF type:complete len:269 (-),score=58.41 TRINITY_DN10498_c0_g1_i1:118-924(-)
MTPSKVSPIQDEPTKDKQAPTIVVITEDSDPPKEIHPVSSTTLVGRAVVLYVLWAAFGFISGFHLMSLLCCPPPASGSRKFLMLHLILHFVALFVFALGGGICRNRGADDCPGGEEMSQSCLLYHQDSTYQFFYITHYMGLAWVVVSWLADGISLWGWSRTGLQQGTLGAFGLCADSVPETSRKWASLGWQYAAVGSCVTVCTVLVWSVKWSTDTPSGGDVELSGLYGILLPVMLVWMGGSCVAVRCLAKQGAEDTTETIVHTCTVQA